MALTFNQWREQNVGNYNGLGDAQEKYNAYLNTPKAYTKEDIMSLSKDDLSKLIQDMAGPNTDDKDVPVYLRNNPEARGTLAVMEKYGLTEQDIAQMAESNPQAVSAFDGRAYFQHTVGSLTGDAAQNWTAQNGNTLAGLNLMSGGEFAQGLLDTRNTNYQNTGSINSGNSIAGELGIGGTIGDLVDGTLDTINEYQDPIGQALTLAGLGGFLGPMNGADPNAVNLAANGVSSGSGALATGVVNPTGSGFTGTGPGVTTAGGSNPLSVNAAVTGTSTTAPSLINTSNVVNGTPSNPTTPNNLPPDAASGVMGGDGQAGNPNSIPPGGTTNPTTNPGGGMDSWIPGVDNADLLNLIGGVGSSYLSNEAANDIIDEQRRQYDQTRADFQPFRQAGLSALSQYQQGINNPTAPAPDLNVSQGANLPQYQSTGQQAAYSNNQSLPDYNPVGEFNFNLEEDAGYNFAKSEAMKATERAMAARGMNNSGNLLTELQNRAAGLASQYTNDAFNRYAAGYDRNYGRNVDTFNINKNLSDTAYQRGVTDYGINAAINTENYNRNVNDYGLNTQRANTMYGRDMDRFNVDTMRNNTAYTRNQNRLAQLGGLADMGAGATGNLATAGQNMANNNSVTLGNNAANISDNINRGMSNYMYNDWMRNGYYNGRR